MFEVKNIAYRDGETAFRRGLKLTDNPYVGSASLAAEWRRGWNDAKAIAIISLD